MAGVQAQIDDLRATLRRLETDLEDLAVSGLVGPARSGAPSTTRYPTLGAWVAEYFIQLYARPIGGETRWCPRWHDHVEAVVRLEAIWRAWEVLRLDPGTGIATWLTTVADPQVAQLLSSSGPFAQCTMNRHQPSTPLGVHLPHSSERHRESPQT
jgi:hypothetical protein